MRRLFLSTMPLVAVLLCLFAFGMLGWVAWLERDSVKGIMVGVAVAVVLSFVRFNRRYFR